ncbi:hypothetical protein CspHIS471_0101620 [Cutaneotrichosporon sp. HIS471]|nr:hypothetical protein CspHIS471_0101620 [Cutaneotrichosporon sp. HIS471]
MEPRVLGTLVVVVGSAKNLPNKSRFGKQDPFCTVQIGNIKRRTLAIKRGGQHPDWDEELRFPIQEDVDDMMATTTSKPLPGEPGVVTPQSMASKSRKPGPKKGGKVMKVAVWADDIKEPELIGEVTVSFDDALVKGEVDDWWTLQSKDGKDKYCGEVYMELTFFSNAVPPRKNPPPKQEQNPIRPPGRPGLPTSSSVSGMNLYIPPYQAQQAQANQTPPQRPPLSQGYANHAPQQTPPQAQPHAPHRPVPNTYASNSFAELGLPPQPPQPPGTGGRPPPVTANSLASQMGSMSLGPSHQQRPGAQTHQVATIGHGRTQSYSASQPPPPPPLPQQPPQKSSQSGGGAAVPWAALMPQGQQQQAPSHPRPVSSNDIGPYHPNDGRASTLPPRPHSSQQQPQVPLPLPLPNHGRTGSLSHNLGPPVAYNNNFQSLPEPPRTTSPAQFGAAYQNTLPTGQPGSFSQPLPTPPPPPQLGGYQHHHQQQPYIPAQAPGQQATWSQQTTQQGYQHGAPPQQFAAQPAAPSGPNTSQVPGAYPNGGYGSPPQHHQPMPPHRNSLPGASQAPSTTTGPYVPWHMQTPAVHGGPAGVPAPPAPPARPATGYYPSDELYAAPQQHQQPQVVQHQQPLLQQPLPPAHQPPPPSLPQVPQPPPPQNYGYASPPPQQKPMSAFSPPPQQQPQSNFRPNAPPRVPSPIGYAPVPPPRMPSPLPPTAPPTNSPPQTNSDWRSYLHGLGNVGGGPPQTAPQAGDWYPPASGSSNTMQHAQAQTGYTPQQW